MVFVGIDVAKDKHDLYAVDSDGVVLCDNFTFANSAAGFASFLKQVSPWGKIKVGIEATGHYSSNLLSFLKAHDFEVVVFNPLSVSRLRSAASLRKTKTDKNDSRYIARLLLTGEAKFVKIFAVIVLFFFPIEKGIGIAASSVTESV